MLNHEYDDEDRIFVGRLAGIDDIVSFHGATVDKLETAFHESVDHYLEVSERTGRPAQKPYSGNLMLRINPDIHAAVATASQVQGKSINQWVAEVLDKDLEPIIGGRGRVSEVLNHRRGLSLSMIRNLHTNLSIPLESLIGEI